jgi:hypothetical protein
MISIKTLCILTTVALTLAVAEAGDCSKYFKQDNKPAEASVFCIKDLKLNPEEQPKSEEEYKTTFDDKVRRLTITFMDRKTSYNLKHS